MQVVPRARILALAALLAGCAREPRERIVLITLDTVRADALASMPATAAFARRGLVFSQAFSATSTTQPTHASLLTGLHPWQHGVTRNGEVLPESAVTLAELLAERGFDTGAVVASFPLARRFGFAQGFRLYGDELRVPYAERWEGEAVADGRFFTLGEDVTDEALTLLDRLTGPKQFLWVHYFDAHDPYGDAAGEANPMPVAALLQAGRERREDVGELVGLARELYARDLGALDRAVARLLARLEADEGFRTHVILTADHGESLGERGCVGHGKRLVPEQVHVPLVLVSPRVAAGERSDAAGSVDVAVTLLALAGLENRFGHGRDLSGPAPGTSAALGMRRSFADARAEQLLDGRELPSTGARFFLARAGRIVSGDAEVVLADDDPSQPLDGPEAAEARAAFQGLQALLEGTAVETLASEEVKDALRALGYAE